MPRVSVIIPAFNAEEHLEQALRSVEGQSYDDWEIVVCDDCSTDGTAALAHAFGDRVTIVRTETNSGPAAARNLAIEHSSGELLALLDADDYWLPAYLERQVALYDSADNMGIVACNAALLRPDGLRGKTYMDVVRFPTEVTLHRLLRSNPIFGSVLVPRRVVNEVGGFCRDLSRGQDFDLWVRIVEREYRVVGRREVLAVHRVGDRSWTSNVQATFHYSQQTYRRALERGNLSPREQRVARRELRRLRLYERITSEQGLSYRRTLRALPLLLLIAAEHPHRWRSIPRWITQGRRAITPLRCSG